MVAAVGIGPDEIDGLVDEFRASPCPSSYLYRSLVFITFIMRSMSLCSIIKGAMGIMENPPGNEMGCRKARKTICKVRRAAEGVKSK